MDAARNHILQKYQVTSDTQLGSGLEAEVYACGPNAVLKLYLGTVSLADLCTLRDFYDSLDRQIVPYALPRILTVAQEDHFCITIEQRLAGIPMSEVLPVLTFDQLDTIMQRYLTATLDVGQLEALSALDRYKLLDSNGLSHRTSGDWHQFLARYLIHKLAQVSPYLSRDVPHFCAKVQHLRTILDQPYGGVYRLIHGDFFPGNLLINADHEIAALLDFGLLTMVGDYLFDIATGWAFFDMYGELPVQVRDHYLALILDRLGNGVRGALYRYVLIYSILSANTYSEYCTDGHYRWCAANLSNQHYWNAIE